MSTATDGTIRVPPDSTGKRLDTAEVTRDDSTVVERQRFVVQDPDGLTADDQARVRDRQVWVVDDRLQQTMDQVLATLCEIRDMLMEVKI